MTMNLEDMEEIKEGMINADMSLREHLASEEHIRQRAQNSQISLPLLLSGDATFLAIKSAIDEGVRLAPDDHDVWIYIGDVSVSEVRFIEPHAFLCEGIDKNGHWTKIICHFSQIFMKVVFIPKLSADRHVSRVITGFADHRTFT